MRTTGTPILDARLLRPGDIIELDGRQSRVFDINWPCRWVELGGINAKLPSYYPSCRYVKDHGRLLLSETKR